MFTEKKKKLDRSRCECKVSRVYWDINKTSTSCCSIVWEHLWMCVCLCECVRFAKAEVSIVKCVLLSASALLCFCCPGVFKPAALLMFPKRQNCSLSKQKTCEQPYPHTHSQHQQIITTIKLNVHNRKTQQNVTIKHAWTHTYTHRGRSLQCKTDLVYFTERPFPHKNTYSEGSRCRCSHCEGVCFTSSSNWAC